MKKGIDYHIMPVGKGFDLSAITLMGFAAGIADLTRRGYKINYGTVQTTISLHTASTIPKPKPKKKPPKKK